MPSSSTWSSSNQSANNGASIEIPGRVVTQDDGSDLDDPIAYSPQDQEVLETDPLEDNTSTSKPTPRNSLSRFGFSNFLSQAWGGRATPLPTPPPITTPGPNILRRRTTPIHSATLDDDEFSAAGPFGSANGFSYAQDAKEAGVNIDWYVEGPGRRVGYEDFTAIDWIFEYAKERQRLRHLIASSTGIIGHIRRFIDATQIWWILICTGIATGAVAASIDVVSDWLGDLKRGVCTHSPFYLNRAFCCWGLDKQEKCRDWKFWGRYFGVSSPSGSYTIEYVVFVLCSVLFAAGASHLVREFSTYAKQSGIPELKTVLGGFVMRQLMSPWTLIIKSVGLVSGLSMMRSGSIANTSRCLAVASGLWLGKEGPLVHVACCLAHLFLRLAPSINENEARKREVLSAAAAAGISVAFGAPVGGVLFSLEGLSFYFPDKTMWQSFVCAMVAAVVLHAFNPFRTGKLVLYQVTYLTQWHAFELAPFALLGVLGGLYGGLFIKLNMRISQWRKKHDIFKSPVVEVAVFAMITALINFPNKYMRAQTSELIETLFSECSELQNEQLGLCGRAPAPVVSSNLIAAAILGFLLTSATFGLQIPSGIILPSMAVGALLGRTVGLIVREINEAYPNLLIFSVCPPDRHCVTAGTYAIVGAAASLAGATRMTVSIVVIMFELTGALNYVLPIMISVMISKWVGDAFGKRGIYEAWINLNKYPFLDNRDDTPVPDVSAAYIMTRIEDIVTIHATGHTLQSLDHLLKTHTFRGFPVIIDSRRPLLLGYISRTELGFAIQSALSGPRKLPATAEVFFTHQPPADPGATLDLRPWMDQTPITLNAKSSLQLAADMFLRLGLRYLMFCERGEIRGILTKKDIWYVLNGTGGERRGVLREESEGEQRGLLGRGGENAGDDDDEDERRATTALKQRQIALPLVAFSALAAIFLALALGPFMMTSKLVPGNPSEVMVIRKISENIATMSHPFSRIGRMKIGARGTIVRMSSGALAVFAPVALTPEVHEQLAELGNDVKYIAALDLEHHIFLGPWHSAFPDAKVLAPEGLQEKREKQQNEKVRFDVIFEEKNYRGPTAAGQPVDEEFDKEFDTEFVYGHINKELVFNHRKERTLIQADLIFNLPAMEQYSKSTEDPHSGFLTKLFTSLENTRGTALGQKRFIWYLGSSGNRTSFNTSVNRISKWDFDRMIPCHGDVVESGAKSMFRQIMGWHLEAARNAGET